jgi:hypothetical protein
MRSNPVASLRRVKRPRQPRRRHCPATTRPDRPRRGHRVQPRRAPAAHPPKGSRPPAALRPPQRHRIRQPAPRRLDAARTGSHRWLATPALQPHHLGSGRQRHCQPPTCSLGPSPTPSPRRLIPHQPDARQHRRAHHGPSSQRTTHSTREGVTTARPDPVNSSISVTGRVVHHELRHSRGCSSAG